MAAAMTSSGASQLSPLSAAGEARPARPRSPSPGCSPDRLGPRGSHRRGDRAPATARESARRCARRCSRPRRTRSRSRATRARRRPAASRRCSRRVPLGLERGRARTGGVDGEERVPGGHERRREHGRLLAPPPPPCQQKRLPACRPRSGRAFPALRRRRPPRPLLSPLPWSRTSAGAPRSASASRRSSRSSAPRATSSSRGSTRSCPPSRATRRRSGSRRSSSSPSSRWRPTSRRTVDEAMEDLRGLRGRLREVAAERDAAHRLGGHASVLALRAPGGDRRAALPRPDRSRCAGSPSASSSSACTCTSGSTRRTRRSRARTASAPTCRSCSRSRPTRPSGRARATGLASTRVKVFEPFPRAGPSAGLRLVRGVRAPRRPRHQDELLRGLHLHLVGPAAASAPGHDRAAGSATRRRGSIPSRRSSRSPSPSSRRWRPPSTGRAADDRADHAHRREQVACRHATGSTRS